MSGKGGLAAQGKRRTHCMRAGPSTSLRFAQDDGSSKAAAIGILHGFFLPLVVRMTPFYGCDATVL